LENGSEVTGIGDAPIADRGIDVDYELRIVREQQHRG
jgi:hypothetical protein